MLLSIRQPQVQPSRSLLEMTRMSPFPSLLLEENCGTASQSRETSREGPTEHGASGPRAEKNWTRLGMNLSDRGFAQGAQGLFIPSTGGVGSIQGAPMKEKYLVGTPGL